MNFAVVLFVKEIDFFLKKRKIMDNIIFLDIDGVLNNNFEWFAYSVSHPVKNNIPLRLISKSNLTYLLNTLKEIDKKNSIKIVISSSWRLSGYDTFVEDIITGCKEKADELLEYLHHDWRVPSKLSSTRGENVLFWLKEHKDEIEKYLCIDDDNDDYLQDQPVLQCNDEYGFGFVESQLALEYFIGKKVFDINYLKDLNFTMRMVLDRQEEFYQKFILNPAAEFDSVKK